MHLLAMIFWLTITIIVLGAYLLEFLMEDRNKRLEKEHSYSSSQDRAIAHLVDEARKNNFKVACYKCC